MPAVHSNNDSSAVCSILHVSRAHINPTVKCKSNTYKDFVCTLSDIQTLSFQSILQDVIILYLRRVPIQWYRGECRNYIIIMIRYVCITACIVMACRPETWFKKLIIVCDIVIISSTPPPLTEWQEKRVEKFPRTYKRIYNICTRHHDVIYRYISR